jgi:hypothetical protein
MAAVVGVLTELHRQITLLETQRTELLTSICTQPDRASFCGHVLVCGSLEGPADDRAGRRGDGRDDNRARARRRCHRPKPFTDTDGTRYLLYSASREGNATIWLQRLHAKGTGTIGQRRAVIQAQRADEIMGWRPSDRVPQG